MHDGPWGFPCRQFSPGVLPAGCLRSLFPQCQETTVGTFNTFLSSSAGILYLVNGLNIGEKNVGTIDRIIRIVVGIALLAGVLMNMVALPLSYLVGLIGLIALVTGAVGTCPAYSLMGISTAGKQ